MSLYRQCDLLFFSVVWSLVTFTGQGPDTVLQNERHGNSIHAGTVAKISFVSEVFTLSEDILDFAHILQPKKKNI